MKKLIFMLLALVAFAAASEAQVVTLKTVENGTGTLDTVTNTETEYLYNLDAATSAGQLAVQAVFTKISGTPNGVASLEFSLDGVNYEAINAADTFHVAPGTSATTHIWYITTSPIHHYRLKVTGRGTAAIQIKGWKAYRKDP